MFFVAGVHSALEEDQTMDQRYMSQWHCPAKATITSKYNKLAFDQCAFFDDNISMAEQEFNSTG
jgi:hypothetical protein